MSSLRRLLAALQKWIRPFAPPPSDGKLIAGVVGSEGEAEVGSGFSAATEGIGMYVVTFPPGTWSSCPAPILTVTPLGQNVVGQVWATQCNPNDGSSEMHVSFMTVEATPVPHGTDFYFIAVQP